MVHVDVFLTLVFIFKCPYFASKTARALFVKSSYFSAAGPRVWNSSNLLTDLKTELDLSYGRFGQSLKTVLLGQRDQSRV